MSNPVPGLKQPDDVLIVGGGSAGAGPSSRVRLDRRMGRNGKRPAERLRNPWQVHAGWWATKATICVSIEMCFVLNPLRREGMLRCA